MADKKPLSAEQSKHLSDLSSVASNFVSRVRSKKDVPEYDTTSQQDYDSAMDTAMSLPNTHAEPKRSISAIHPDDLESAAAALAPKSDLVDEGGEIGKKYPAIER